MQETEHTTHKVCLITEVSKGLGITLALKFKEERFTVIGISISEIDFHIKAYLTEINS